MIKLGIIEDTKSIRDVLEVYFDQEEEFDVHKVAQSSEDFLNYRQIGQLDVVLCDIGLPGRSGMETAWIIKEKYAEVQVIMFTVFEDRQKIFQSLQAGASGYLLKNTPLPQIKNAVLEVVKGGAAMSPQIAKKVIDYFKLSANKSKKDTPETLTAREADVINQIQQGFSNKMISENLFISIDTVKYHIRNIYQKLQISSRKELLEQFNNPYEPIGEGT